MADNDEPQIFKKRYKVDKKLGAGNFGTAYLVTDRKEKNDPKVLKVVRLGEMDSEQTVDSVREAELLSNLDNEYIVKFHESFLENDCLCIVTEYCEGGGLDQRLKELKKQNQPLDEDQIVEWLIQILTAVQYMHKCKVLHRDLKAKNIFLKSNKVKIGDFGISRILTSTIDLSTRFTIVPCHMSPEIMKNDGYDSKSDIWSVGCLLYQMCTYQHAFDGKGLVNVICKVVEGKAPDIPKTYSKELNDILKKMFIKDPKNRPSAMQLLETPFIIEHRRRTKLTGPLQDTIDGNLRFNQIRAPLESLLKSHDWSLSSKDHIVDDEQSDDTPSNQPNKEEEEQALKPQNTLNSEKQTTIEKKIYESDAPSQLSIQPIQSNEITVNQNRLKRSDNPLIIDATTNQVSSEVIKTARSSTLNKSPSDTKDTLPVIQMRRIHGRMSDPFDDKTCDSQQQSTKSALSRPINPRCRMNSNQPLKSLPSARSTDSKTKQNDSNAILKVDPKYNEFDRILLETKTDALRIKAIKLLGEATFEKVYDYLVKQRTAQKRDPTIDEKKINQGLAAFPGKPSDYFLVDQLVILDMMAL